MIVVSDTSPLNYLILINAEHVLPVLYGRVVVPTVVYEELQSGMTPSEVREWLHASPPWLEVHRVPEHLVPHDIHAGEAAAIALAKSLQADLMLMDDHHARLHATNEGLRVTGTLGVLRDAAGLGLIDLRRAFERLKQTNFRAPPTLFDSVLEQTDNQ